MYRHNLMKHTKACRVPARGGGTDWASREEVANALRSAAESPGGRRDILGALRIRRGFWAPVCYIYTQEPPK